MKLRTREQVIAEFSRMGISVSGWASEHGVARQVVDGLLKGKLKGRRGSAHDVAVLLGLKDGIVADRHRQEKASGCSRPGKK